MGFKVLGFMWFWVFGGIIGVQRFRVKTLGCGRLGLGFWAWLPRV